MLPRAMEETASKISGLKSILWCAFAVRAIVFVLMVGALPFAPAVADEEGWHTFSSPEYHFTVKVPGKVTHTVGKSIENEQEQIFDSKYHGSEYKVLVMDFPKTYSRSSKSIQDIVKEKWPKLKETHFDAGANAEDVSGNGWAGIAFNGTISGQTTEGIFGGSPTIEFLAFVIGDADEEDRNKFIDSFTVTDTDNGSSASNSSTDQSNSDKDQADADDSSSKSSASQSSTSADDGSSGGMSTAAADAEEKKIEDQTTEILTKYGLWIALAAIFGSTILIAAVVVLVVFLIKRNNK